MGANQKPTGPDLKEGVELSSLSPDGKLLGQVDGEAVLVIRRGGSFFAVGAICSHYGANLNDGILTEDGIHCPWHHACFNLQTGEAVKAPALNPVSAWETAVRAGKIFVLGKKTPIAPKAAGLERSKFVIVGSGAAGHAAAEMLRRLGYDGSLILLSEDTSLPYDRPNLSKDYLAGSAPEEWMALRSREFYKEQKIEIRLGATVSRLDPIRKRISLSSGEEIRFDKCLLATGGAPIKPDIEGVDSPNVYFLRTFADCQRLIGAAEKGKKVFIVGAGFIGLEAAAALRSRGLEVTVAAPQDLPLARVVGPEMGALVKSVHEANGVQFRLGQKVVRISAHGVELGSGERVAADFILVATGISPNISLAREAGLDCGDGILVNEFLETSAEGIFAAGDVTRWPDANAGENIRVEHWVVAQRQGQVAAMNLLGKKQKYIDVPFFWSQQFDLGFNYVGHAHSWTRSEIHGSLGQKNFAIAFFEGDKVAAVLTVGRDQQSLRIEQAFQSLDQAAIKKILQE